MVDPLIDRSDSLENFLVRRTAVEAPDEIIQHLRSPGLSDYLAANLRISRGEFCEEIYMRGGVFSRHRPGVHELKSALCTYQGQEHGNLIKHAHTEGRWCLSAMMRHNNLLQTPRQREHRQNVTIKFFPPGLHSSDLPRVMQARIIDVRWVPCSRDLSADSNLAKIYIQPLRYNNASRRREIIIDNEQNISGRQSRAE